LSTDRLSVWATDGHLHARVGEETYTDQRSQIELLWLAQRILDVVSEMGSPILEKNKIILAAGGVEPTPKKEKRVPFFKKYSK